MFNSAHTAKQRQIRNIAQQRPETWRDVARNRTNEHIWLDRSTPYLQLFLAHHRRDQHELGEGERGGGAQIAVPEPLRLAVYLHQQRPGERDRAMSGRGTGAGQRKRGTEMEDGKRGAWDPVVTDHVDSNSKQAYQK